MSKEVLKIALEALEPLEFVGKRMDGGNPKIDEAITAIKEALANEALEKMAENARELGLDYEPPQRTWVGLTDEDISEIVRGTHNTGSFVRAIEAKLRSKNESKN